MYLLVEPGGQLNHPHPKVGVVDVEVVGDAPHDDQVHPLLLQLPGQSARGSSKTEEEKLGMRSSHGHSVIVTIIKS